MTLEYKNILQINKFDQENTDVSPEILLNRSSQFKHKGEYTLGVVTLYRCMELLQITAREHIAPGFSWNDPGNVSLLANFKILYKQFTNFQFVKISSRIGFIDNLIIIHLIDNNLISENDIKKTICISSLRHQSWLIHGSMIINHEGYRLFYDELFPIIKNIQSSIK